MLHSWWLLLASLLVAADETGKCLSDLDEPVFGAQDAASCWLNCVGEYGSQIVAIDFYDDDDTCYCESFFVCVDE